jgi:hypothetical protein
MKPVLVQSELTRIAPIKISQLVCGVRFEPQYSVLDRIGTVVDYILRSPGTPFDPNVFPLSTVGNLNHILHNKDNTASISITSQDLVLQLPLDTESLDQVREYISGYERFILEPMRNFANLQNIVRYGMVISISGNVSAFQTPPIQRYLSSDFPEATDLIMRFSKRLPTEAGMFRSHVENFRNVIFLAEQAGNGNVRLSLDYQLYFLPALVSKEHKSTPYPDFTEHGLRYFQNEFMGWVEKLAGVLEAA